MHRGITQTFFSWRGNLRETLLLQYTLIWVILPYFNIEAKYVTGANKITVTPLFLLKYSMEKLDPGKVLSYLHSTWANDEKYVAQGNPLLLGIHKQKKWILPTGDYFFPIDW